MTALHSTDFQRYLESVCTAYEHWWSLDTLRNAVSQQPIGQEKSRSPFDFGLIVEMVKPQSGRGKVRETTERLPVLEGLQKYAALEHLLLVGRPGSGKSTALARFLVDAAKQALQNPHNQIPVLVQLRQYRNPGTNESGVWYLIQDFLEAHDLLLEISDIRRLLFEKRFLLLVDGLNELPTNSARTDLKAFRQKYSRLPIIFTTRDLGVRGDLDIRQRLEIQSLSEVEIQRFAHDCLPGRNQQTLRQLGERLLELGQTPFVMWMLYFILQKTGNVPSSRGEAFREFTQRYERGSKEDAPVTDESRRWWSQLLEHLAFEMMHTEKLTDFRLTISEREAKKIFTAFLKGKEEHPDRLALICLEDLLKHHLIQLNPQNREIEFCHHLIQEYYAAEWLLQHTDNLSDDSLKQNYLNYVKWTPSLALMLALADEAQSVQALRVVKLALEVYIRLGAWLAGESKPELQVQTVALVSEQDIPQLLKIDLLSVTRSDSAIPALLQALADGDSDMKGLIIEALANIGTEAANSVISSNSSLLQPDLILVEAEPFDWDFHDQFRTQLLSGILKELEQIEEDRQKVKQLVPMFIQAFSQMLCNYLADGYEWLILADHSLVTADDPLVPTNKTTLINKSCMSVGYALGLIGGAELLPDLFKILLAETSNSISIRFAIEMIQRHYQYYNYTLYKLATSPPPQEESITNELLAGTKIYIEKVEKIDCGSASIGAVNIDSIIPGNQIGTQHNK